MIILATISTIAIVLALGLGASPATAATAPTLSDIAGCNEEAAARTGGSAAPHPGRRTPETAQRDPSSPPRADGRPDIPPGPGDRSIDNAPPPAGAPPPSGTGAPGEKTDPSGSVITETPDPLLRGMDAAKADDPQYRAAYRECMQARLGVR